MRYLGIFKGADQQPMPTADEIERMGQLIEEMAGQGVLLATEGCLPTSHGLRVRNQGGEYTVVDGPFVETKEQIGGFALLQVNSREELIYWTKRFAELAGDGEIELRALYETPAYNPQVATGDSDRTTAAGGVA